MADENTEAAQGSTPSPQEEKDRAAWRITMLTKAIDRLTDIESYLGRIDDVIKAILPELAAKQPLGEALDIYIKLENAFEAIEAQIKALGSRFDAAREVSFPARLDDEDTRTTTAASGNRMTRTTKLFASMLTKTEAGEEIVVPDGGKLKFVKGSNTAVNQIIEQYPELAGEYPDLVGLPLGFVWLRQNGLGSLIKPTVNASSLTAAAKAKLEEGYEVPGEMFRTFTKDNVSITRAPGFKPAPKAKK